MSGASPRIALIHALTDSIAPIEAAIKRHWPQVQWNHLLDSGLSGDRASGEFDEAHFIDRLLKLTGYAVTANADAVLFCCSAFNDAIDVCKENFRLPIVKPDEAMLEAALGLGERITLVATFEATLGSSELQLTSLAATQQRKVDVSCLYVQDALTALKEGDGERHDDLIARAVAAATPSDVILLGQFSMARAADLARAATSTPLLTSPDTAVIKLRDMFV